MLTTTDAKADLPRRTWRKWWRNVPGYWRIAVWTAVVFVMIHLAFAARIAIGLRESSQITSLKARGAGVQYWWEDHQSDETRRRYNRFPGHQTLIAGFYGRSPWNVATIWMDDIATDDDLRRIGVHFRQLQGLNLKHSHVTNQGVMSLKHCRQLRHLNLSQTEIDDESIRLLVELPQLRYLDVNRTLITEQAILLLKKLDAPEYLLIEWTAASFVPLETKPDLQSPFERAVRSTRKPGIIATLRWSDGKRSPQFDGRREFWIEGPLTINPPPVSREHSYFLEEDNLFWWSTERFAQLADGEYRFCLKLNDVLAEPVRVFIKAGVPTTDRIEFRMPITKTATMNAD